MGVGLCRPYGATPFSVTHTHRSRGGLRSFVPDGTNQYEGFGLRYLGQTPTAIGRVLGLARSKSPARK
jgi:hypothetical protein